MKINIITKNKPLASGLSSTSHYTVDTDQDDSVMVAKYGWLKFDEPLPYVNVRNLLVGDTIWTLHKGKAEITEIMPGFFRFDGKQELFAIQPQLSFPLVSRGTHIDATLVRDWS
jgi:hypothetical protein